jgi:hypothetical protein
MPSSPGYKRDYKQERLNETPARKKARVMRNEARQMMIKKGSAKVGDGKDVGHIKAISKGGKTTLTNLAMQTPTSNRSFKRNSSGAMVSETSKKEASRRKK